MKYLIITVIALFSLNGISQSNDSTKNYNKTDVVIGNITISKNDEGGITIDTIKVKTYPNVEFIPTFDLGVAGYSKEPGEGAVLAVSPYPNYNSLTNVSTELDYSKSRNFGINFNLVFNFTKNVGLVTGFGLNYNSYTFRENMTIDPKTGHFLEDTVITYNKYKFKNNYVQVPLMLKFQTSNEDFQFALGGTVGYNFRSKVKAKYSFNGTEYKTVIKDNYNVTPLKLSVGARFNYKGVGLYFNYGVTEFLSGQDNTIANYSLMPFEAGITFGSF
jgi:hypothetical protein